VTIGQDLINQAKHEYESHDDSVKRKFSPTTFAVGHGRGRSMPPSLLRAAKSRLDVLSVPSRLLDCARIVDSEGLYSRTKV
jgi:hypothetical protein